MGMAASFALALACFLPALSHSFLNWDEILFVTAAPEIRGLGATELCQIFGGSRGGNYTPLERLSYALDYQLWGMSAPGFILTNLLLHAANAALVFLLAWRLYSLTRDRCPQIRLWLGSLLAACVFSLHPLRVESVVWIAERRDPLFLFWLLLSTHCYLQARAPESARAARRWRMAALALYGCSLLSKAAAVTFPLVLLLIDGFPLRRFALARSDAPALRRCIREKVPWFALGLGIGLLAMGVQHHDGGLVLRGFGGYPPAARLANAGIALVFYVRQWIFPWALSPLYAPLPLKASFSALSVGSMAWLLMVSGATLVGARKHPALAVAWWSYLALILPLSGLLPVTVSFAADRYTYLTLLPFAFLAGGLLLRNMGRAGMAGLAALLVWGIQTERQIPVWRNSQVFWQHVLREVPSEPLVLNNEGIALLRDGNPFLATTFFREALALDPRSSMGWFNEGMALSQSRRSAPAMAAFRRAIQIDPDLGRAHHALGNELLARGDAGAACGHFYRAIQDEITADRIVSLALALEGRGRGDLAMKYLRWAGAMNDPDAFAVGAAILLRQGRAEAARALLKEGWRRTGSEKLRSLLGQSPPASSKQPLSNPRR